MNLERLKVFYVVAKHGSFTKAATALNITQPPLTVAIKLLEQELQAKLFIRSSRGVVLTPEGEKLFEFSSRFIEEAEITRKLIKDNAGEPQGELKIISTPYLASTWLPKFFASFFKKYPKLETSIIGSLENIDIAHADIAIRTFIPHHPHIIQNPLYSFHSKLWASAEYLQEYGVPTTPEDLDKHRLICFKELDKSYGNYGSTQWILNVGSHQKPREPYMTTNSVEGLINLASYGLGIIESPQEYVEIKHTHLVQILPWIQSPIIEVFYSYSELIKDSNRIQAFKKYVQEIFS
jgi:DNA-binding transcriptional LysR family regulator